VNLAARICDVSTSNEIVFSADAWKLMRSHFGRRGFMKRTSCYQLKGFAGAVEAVHVSVECPELKRQGDFETDVVLPVAA
jgi:class 3 adenylate cyclase